MAVKGQPHSYGTEFVFTFPYFGGGASADRDLSLLLTTELKETVTVTVSVPGINYTNVTYVTRDQSVTFDLPLEVAIEDGGQTTYTNKTVIVRSTGLVSVHGYYGHFQSSDGFLVLPTTFLGTEYVVQLIARVSNFVVSALQVSTSITMSWPMTGRNRVIFLQQYESYEFLFDTGFFITSKNPVSVMFGDSCAHFSIPSGGWCNYVVEHLPPISSLGRQYILAPFMGRTTGYIFRIEATNDFTNVAIADMLGNSNISLMSGEVYQDDVNEVIKINADKSVLVIQFAKSPENDERRGAVMVVIPPTESYSKNVSFPVVTLPTDVDGGHNHYRQEHYISVVTSCENSATLSLDRSHLDSTDDMLVSPDSTFCALRTLVSSGLHSVTHPDPEASFLVLVYGFNLDSHGSCGYVAGYNIQTPTEVDVITDPMTISKFSTFEPNTLSAVSTGGTGGTRCPSFAKTDDGIVSPDKDWYDGGDIVTIYCSQGYHVVGDGKLVCTNSGSWHGQAPKCLPINQGDIPDGSTPTSIIIGASVAGVGILVIMIVIGVVIYCKRLKKSELSQLPVSYNTIPDNSSVHPPIDTSGPELPENHPYYISPLDNSSVHPPIVTSDPELPEHLPVYSTHIQPDNSSERPSINTSGPELPAHLPVSYSTYIPPLGNSSGHPPIGAPGYDIPLGSNYQGLYAEVTN
ncbi:uncharacterized protein [Amphiura filiformis]|uniref:uncharacterized protein n=1 Tax=Amphiura filiformis TaxID=82378 RepID=UPI003B225AA6